nr:SafA/ExsA family spore coat assembly protein [Bacillus dakarensis]
MKIHIVQKGDTLWEIAKKYGVNFEELKKMNSQLSNPDMIMPGMKIKVPSAGGSVKKEAPIGGKPGAINIGAKKEMPKKEQPIVKEQPKPAPPPPPPKEPIMEEESIEEPIETPKEVKKAPVKPAPPKVEAPKMEAPKAEVPKKPFVPKMPKPVIPDIDINNYYMMNMANLKVEQQAAEQSQPKMPPQLPPKPKNILPEIKPYTPDQEETFEESSMNITQGGYQQPMYPYQHPMYPISPVMPGSGLGHQGGCPQFHGGHYPPMQDPMMQHPMMQSPMMQSPMMQQPMMQAPMQHGGYPEVAGVQNSYYDDESSPFMPQMPSMPNAGQMPSVMGAQDFNDAGMPHMPNAAPMMQAPMMQSPMMQSPMMQAPYPCPPFGGPLYPISPVMPGPGPVPPYPQPYQGYPAMPQVQGAVDPYDAPDMYGGNMPHQMPFAPNQPFPAVQGVSDDCGCGGSHLVGSYGPPSSAQYGPDPYSQGMPGGFNPAPYGGGPGGFGPGQQQFQAQPYGQQMASPPFMNPYGPMGAGYGMPRNMSEDEENED